MMFGSRVPDSAQWWDRRHEVVRTPAAPAGRSGSRGGCGRQKTTRGCPLGFYEG